MTDHWDWLEKNLGDDLSFPRFPLYSASAFSDISFLPTYKKFFRKVSSPVLERSIKQGIEIIQWQSAWRHRDIRAVKQFFKN
jgi:aminopeptidase N